VIGRAREVSGELEVDELLVQAHQSAPGVDGLVILAELGVAHVDAVREEARRSLAFGNLLRSGLDKEVPAETAEYY